MDYEKLMTKARETNAKRDQMDKEAGFATPWQAGADAVLLTIRDAIKCGIVTNNWSNVAEAQAILEKMIEVVGAAKGARKN